MKEQVIRSIGLVVSAAVLGGCLVWFFTPNPNPEDAGEWKSTGDGKTIVNSKTGELRLTRTGESVEFAEEMRLREIELNKIIAEKNARKREEETANREAADRSRKDREAQYAQQNEISRRSTNSERYRQIKRFVELRWDEGFRPAPAGSKTFTEWYVTTLPIRDGKPLTHANAKALSELIERLRGAELYRTSQAIVAAVRDGQPDRVDTILTASDSNLSVRTAEWDRILSLLNSVEFSSAAELVPLPSQ